MNMFAKSCFIIPIIFVLISIEISAQKFEDYQQKVEGEKFDFELVAITGGNFMMGNVETVKSSDEKPLHNIEVDDFWMGKYEISWTQYDAFVYAKNTADAFIPESELHKLGIDAITGASVPYVEMSFGMGKENFPAVNMTQYAALMYCKWLTAKTGIFYRLPTEAEWEYVCKKGKTDSDNALTQVAWYDENANNKYQNIGSKKSNVLGIYDLLGNVSEWVLDQYSITYYANSPENNPWNIPKTLYPIVVRGGSWKDTAKKVCCSARGASKSKWKQRDPQIPKSNWWFTDASFVGFRIVRPEVQPSQDEISKYWLEPIKDFGLD